MLDEFAREQVICSMVHRDFNKREFESRWVRSPATG